MRRRLHPLDLAAAAVALVTVAWVLVTVRGYRWAGTVASGFLRVVPVELTLEVRDPVWKGLAAELSPGRFDADTAAGTLPVEVLAVRGGADFPVVVLEVRVAVQVDGAGNAFWAGSKMRRGSQVILADRSRLIVSVITAMRGLEPPP